MSLIEYLLIAIAGIAVIMLAITVIRRISAYYRRNYNMSVWAGMFLLTIATVAIVYSLYHYGSVQTPIYIISALLLLITLILDVHHAGAAMGFLAFLFQTVMAAAFIAVVAGVVIYYIVRSLRRGDDMVMDALTGTTSGFRNGVHLFFRFFSL